MTRLLKPSLASLVAEAAVSPSPRLAERYAIKEVGTDRPLVDYLAGLANLERRYDGPIPQQERDALRGSPNRRAIIEAQGNAEYLACLIRDQIKTIRGYAAHDHLPPAEHGARMAGLYRDLRLYLKRRRACREEAARLAGGFSVEARARSVLAKVSAS